MHVFEVRNGELIESLTQKCAEQGITDAAIVAYRNHRFPLPVHRCIGGTTLNRLGDSCGHLAGLAGNSTPPRRRPNCSRHSTGSTPRQRVRWL
jgi:hypothetical protein